MNILKIQEEVGRWSQGNFGNQKGLEHHAPIQGIVEEFGELTEAIEDDKEEERIDSIGDICVYILDYSYRRGIPATDFWPNTRTDYTEAGVIITLGKLLHINLKTHQGIRGYEDATLSKYETCTQLTQLLEMLEDLEDINDCLTTAWEEVKARDWKENPNG